MRKAKGELCDSEEAGALKSDKVDVDCFRVMVRLHFVPLTMILSVVEG
jgi:hypothetical protein